MARLLLALLLTVPAGCLPVQMFDAPTGAVMPVVPGGLAGSAKLPGPVLTNYRQGATDTCLRVDRVGRDVIAANPDVGVRPRFATIGKDHPEIFHQGTDVVWVTEGLANRCKGDGQLAALLCLELGKMVAEREALGPPPARGEAPPLQVAIGNTASPGAVDLVALAERSRFENDRKQKARRQPLDATALAQTYLKNAGHGTEQLASVAPLLAEADKNYLIEKQFNGPPGGGSWRAVQP